MALTAFDPCVGDQVDVSGGGVLEVDVLAAEGLGAEFTRRTRRNIFFGTLRHYLVVCYDIKGRVVIVTDITFVPLLRHFELVFLICVLIKLSP